MVLWKFSVENFTFVLIPMIIYFLNLFSPISHLIPNSETCNLHSLLDPSSFRYLIPSSLFLCTVYICFYRFKSFLLIFSTSNHFIVLTVLFCFSYYIRHVLTHTPLNLPFLVPVVLLIRFLLNFAARV